MEQDKEQDKEDEVKEEDYGKKRMNSSREDDAPPPRRLHRKRRLQAGHKSHPARPGSRDPPISSEDRLLLFDSLRDLHARLDKACREQREEWQEQLRALEHSLRSEADSRFAAVGGILTNIAQMIASLTNQHAENDTQRRDEVRARRAFEGQTLECYAELRQDVLAARQAQAGAEWVADLQRLEAELRSALELQREDLAEVQQRLVDRECARSVQPSTACREGTCESDACGFRDELIGLEDDVHRIVVDQTLQEAQPEVEQSLQGLSLEPRRAARIPSDTHPMSIRSASCQASRGSVGAARRASVGSHSNREVGQDGGYSNDSFEPYEEDDATPPSPHCSNSVELTGDSLCFSTSDLSPLPLLQRLPPREAVEEQWCASLCHSPQAEQWEELKAQQFRLGEEVRQESQLCREEVSGLREQLIASFETIVAEATETTMRHVSTIAEGQRTEEAARMVCQAVGAELRMELSEALEVQQAVSQKVHRRMGRQLAGQLQEAQERLVRRLVAEHRVETAEVCRYAEGAVAVAHAEAAAALATRPVGADAGPGYGTLSPQQLNCGAAQEAAAPVAAVPPSPVPQRAAIDASGNGAESDSVTAEVLEDVRRAMIGPAVGAPCAQLGTVSLGPPPGPMAPGLGRGPTAAASDGAVSFVTAVAEWGGGAADGVGSASSSTSPLRGAQPMRRSPYASSSSPGPARPTTAAVRRHRGSAPGGAAAALAPRSRSEPRLVGHGTSMGKVQSLRSLPAGARRRPEVARRSAKWQGLQHALRCGEAQSCTEPGNQDAP